MVIKYLVYEETFYRVMYRFLHDIMKKAIRLCKSVGFLWAPQHSRTSHKTLKRIITFMTGSSLLTEFPLISSWINTHQRATAITVRLSSAEKPLRRIRPSTTLLHFRQGKYTFTTLDTKLTATAKRHDGQQFYGKLLQRNLSFLSSC